MASIGGLAMIMCVACREAPQAQGIGVLFDYGAVQMFLPTLVCETLCLQCTVSSYLGEPALPHLAKLQTVTKEGFVVIDTDVLSQPIVKRMKIYSALINSLHALYPKQVLEEVLLSQFA